MPEEERIREIFREELSSFLGVERYTFQKHIQIFNGRNIQLGIGIGTKIGTASTQKLGLWGVTPVDQPDAVSDPTTSTVTDNAETTNNTTINSNFNELKGKINTILDILQEVGIIK